MKQLCFCRCHQDETGDLISFATAQRHEDDEESFEFIVNEREPKGVDVFDAMEAAVACSNCINGHCKALRSRKLANEEPRVVDPTAWKDRPRHQSFN